MQAAKGHSTGPAEDGSKMDSRAIMQAEEIKAARLKDKSVMKSEVELYEGNWQCHSSNTSAIKEKIRHKRCCANSDKIYVHLF